MQCKSLRESGAQLKAFDIAYFMVSVDDEKTNKEFAENTSADFPILSDTSKATAEAYGALMPRGFSYRWTFYIGADGKILHIDKEVNPAKAGEDTIERLTALGVSKTEGLEN